MTLEPSAAVDLICGEPASVHSVADQPELLGLLYPSESGLWVPNGPDGIAVDACDPGGSSAPASYRVPDELGPGDYTLCRGFELDAAGCAMFTVVPLADSDDPDAVPLTTLPPEIPVVPDTIPAAEATRIGEEIGSGSIGPPIAVPQPWSNGTIYSDLEPQALFVEFIPPNPQCIAAQAKATIGRGGAILIEVFVDGERSNGPCADSADGNRIRISLSEPLGNRRIYTFAEPETDAASRSAELLADSIIGLDVADAKEAIRSGGFEVRDLTGLDAVNDDRNLNRINISTSNGVVDFAAVY